MNNQLKHFMLVEIPVSIDWNLFGNLNNEEKENILNQIIKDLVDKPITTQIEDVDDYGQKIQTERVEGIITNAEIMSQEEISVFGIMWINSRPEFSIVSSQEDGKQNLKISGINISYQYDINKLYYNLKEQQKNIDKKIQIAMDYLNIGDDKK